MIEMHLFLCFINVYLFKDFDYSGFYFFIFPSYDICQQLI